MKPYTSIKRKMEEDNVKEPQELSDLVRGRLYFSDSFTHDDALNIIDRLFSTQIQSVDHKGSHSREHGLEYSGVTHVDININGVRFELQILPLEFKPYKEFLHQIYEKFRNPKTLSKLTDKQKELLRKVHNKAYKKLDDHAKKARSSKSSLDD
jgi:hypothetical protein